jgi:hypothetical protein
MTRAAATLPLPACGERVGVRGGNRRRSKRPPLTLTLSPSKGWGEGIAPAGGTP